MAFPLWHLYDVLTLEDLVTAWMGSEYIADTAREFGRRQRVVEAAIAAGKLHTRRVCELDRVRTEIIRDAAARDFFVSIGEKPTPLR